MDLVSNQGSERATSGGGGKLVSWNGKTHIVWQDCIAPARPIHGKGNVPKSDGYLNQVRTFDHKTGQFSSVCTLNKGVDNHARPNIVMDYEGYLHAVISGHNSPVTYRRSVERNDASGWTEPEIIGEGTYPIPVCGSDGTLYLTMRSADRWNGVDLYVKPSDEKWDKRTKLVHRDPDLTGYGAFHGGLAISPEGILHTVIDFYESEAIWHHRGLHQAVAYMKSDDGGRSWTRADGTPVELSARPPQMDVIARDIARERHEKIPPPLILAQGSILLDRDQQPHVFYIDHRRGPGQLMHAQLDGEGKWSRKPIHALNTAFPEHRPTGCRGSFTIRSDGTMFGLLELLPLGEGWKNGLPTRAMGFDENLSKRGRSH
ncbi:MAG: BNR-4 repeat-containing protein [Planctomycetes bacterium]|nr:BNR-4 repeat-containing protein [Planctomycetota bacterium]